MTKMKTALLQMEVVAGDVAVNRRTAMAMIAEAVSRGAELVVLPEIWTTGYALRELDRLAETMEGETLNLLREQARTHKITVISGSIPFKEAEKVYNAAFVIRPDGTVAASYRKIHLFSLMGEERFFTPGKEKAVFDLGPAQAGLVICYDIRFPELSRALALAGAQALFVPAEWPSARGDHWRTLNIARAIENQMYVVAVNCVGQHKQNVFFGHSLLVDPWGEVVAEGGDRPAVIMGEIDFAKVAQVREAMSVFADRRPDIY